MSTTLDDHLVHDLSGRISGRVLAPGDSGYDDARAVHNGLVDKRPALIVRARSADDVVGALALAHTVGLEVSIRGGGHNVAGRAVAEGGVMIDLAEMKAIAVDPERATVTAGGGVLWSELNEATGAHGLAVTGGAVSSTGIAGLTLGGGLGWLMGKYGLAADNLIGAEMVTAQGEVIFVDETEYPDLLWALRGGGGNFGVVTSLTYRLHPVNTITGGLIAHPFDAAPELLRFYRDAVAHASDDLTVFAGLVHAPDGSGHKLAAFVVCHLGDPESAQEELAPFTGFGSPLMAQVGPMPYPVMNTLLDGGYPKGSLNYWLVELHQRAERRADRHLRRAVRERPVADDGDAVRALPRRGAPASTRRRPPSRTASPGWNLLIPSVWLDPAATDGQRRVDARDARRAPART